MLEMAYSYTENCVKFNPHNLFRQRSYDGIEMCKNALDTDGIVYVDCLARQFYEDVDREKGEFHEQVKLLTETVENVNNNYDYLCIRQNPEDDKKFRLFIDVGEWEDRFNINSSAGQNSLFKYINRIMVCMGFYHDFPFPQLYENFYAPEVLEDSEDIMTIFVGNQSTNYDMFSLEKFIKNTTKETIEKIECIVEECIFSEENPMLRGKRILELYIEAAKIDNRLSRIFDKSQKEMLSGVETAIEKQGAESHIFDRLSRLQRFSEIINQNLDYFSYETSYFVDDISNNELCACESCTVDS